MLAAEWLSRKIIFVLGKGGVGKSTVARQAAEQLAESGKRTLLCHVAFVDEPEQVLKETKPGLYEISLNATECFNEYVAMKLKIKPLYTLLLGNRIARYLQHAAPGIRELVLMGKIWFERAHYDHIVVDMPSSGYALTMLQTPINFADLFPGGPIYQDCHAMLETFSDADTTAIVAITLAEEMPAQESCELADKIAKQFSKNPPWLVINRVFVLPKDLEALQGKTHDRSDPLWAMLEHLVCVAKEHAESIEFLRGQQKRFAGSSPLILPDISLPRSKTAPQQKPTVGVSLGI